jgi:hypothetical protein
MKENCAKCGKKVEYKQVPLNEDQKQRKIEGCLAAKCSCGNEMAVFTYAEDSDLAKMMDGFFND